MMKQLFPLILFVLISINAFAQDEAPVKEKKEKNRAVYFAWGYNKDWYTKSTIHFKSGSASDFNYDFKWVKVKAEDRPRLNDVFNVDPAIPQYAYRLGYMFNVKKGMGVEYNFDHSKYIVTIGQPVHVQGNINNQYYDIVTEFTKDSMNFEHTNGANFAMINFFCSPSLYASKNQKFEIAFTSKAGAGIVVPKTDVTLFGERLDNKFHIAGYIIGIEEGVTFYFWRDLFLLPSVKFSYANYVNALTVDNGTAQHSFGCMEAIVVIGYRYRF